MRQKASTRLVLLLGLAVALLLAGVVSYYASNSPDGMNRVAQDQGFAGSQKSHQAADAPFAGYETKGVGDHRLSGGLAGVAGSVLVLTLSGGIAYGVRRRRTTGEPSTSEA